jgi:hypothetical protein
VILSLSSSISLFFFSFIAFISSTLFLALNSFSLSFFISILNSQRSPKIQSEHTPQGYHKNVYMFIVLSFSLCLSIFLFLSICLSFDVSLSLSLSFFICLSFCFLSLSPAIYPLSIHGLSLFVYMSLFLCRSLFSFFVSLFLYLSLCFFSSNLSFFLDLP